MATGENNKGAASGAAAIGASAFSAGALRMHADGKQSVAEAEALLRMMSEAAETGTPRVALSLIEPRIMPPIRESAAEEDSRSGIWKADRRYRALIEQIPVVTFMAAMDETIHDLYVSPQIQAVLGFTQAEWLDNPFLWYNQLHPDDRERWQQEFGRTCATGVHFKSEYRLLARDGRVVWIHGECQLIRDDQGKPLFLQGVAYDITESKRAQEELRRMHRDLELIVQRRTGELAIANETLRAEVAERREAQVKLAAQATELARSNADLSQFAYVASHDLQEPLRMMSSFAELLAERYGDKLDSNAAEFIHFITDGARRMRDLIQDLLAYSRAGRGESEMRPVRCDDVLRAACDNLRVAIDGSGTRIKADSLPVVSGHRSQLLQLFQNLIGNAVKFTAAGMPPEITLEVRRDGNHWLFSVRDNGIGFDPQYGDKIFLIFQRLQSRVDYPGTGIGLAICRKIVERHGGRIWAESQPNQGSTFFFTLPATEAHHERIGE